MILKLEELSTGYGRKVLLEDISLDAEAGKVICLAGANGSGKSTLLKTICGEIPALKGKVFFNNKELESLSQKEIAFHVASVYTERPPTGELTVSDLVALGRIPFLGRTGAMKESDRIKTQEAIQLLGLNNFSSHKVSELSDGEKQRVFIARAIAQDTPLIILDEPTAFLDVVYRKKLMEWLRDLSSHTGKTFILSVHDLPLITRYADELWCIDVSGKLNRFSEVPDADKIYQLISGE